MASLDQRHGLSEPRTAHRAVDNLLADPRDLRRERSLNRQPSSDAVDKILNGILERRAKGGFVIVGADRAVLAFENEPALRLRLVNPRIGECAPTRLEFRQAALV